MGSFLRRREEMSLSVELNECVRGIRAGADPVKTTTRVPDRGESVLFGSVFIGATGTPT
jgi:hypothetical protein